MKLKLEDAGLFYEMFLPLLDYVNEKYHVTKEAVHFEGERVDPSVAAQVARFLWERPWFIDDYIAEATLPEEQREIILSWKRRIFGIFIIEQHLKKGSIFISAENESVYLVKGIMDSWEEMFQGIPTPLVVKTTLLPFRNLIISDGLVTPYLTRFGKKLTDEVRHTYIAAKKNHKIISQI